MKKILILLALFTGLIACENFNQEFPDYKFNAVYFPYQYPVRTLVLGDDIFDNTNDNNHMFLISATIGGLMKNTLNRVLSIEVDESLCDNVNFNTTDTIRLMPPSYYTLSPNSTLTIPSGKLIGSIEVHLTDAFFNDPLAIRLNYVIPIRITGTDDADSVLSGLSLKPTPDPRIVSDWNILPKDFTMFAVKFVNPYHGTYLHRGTTVTKEIATNTVVNTQVQHKPYIVDDEVWKVATSAKNQVLYTGNLRSTQLPGPLKMYLNFTDDGNCTITDAGSAFAVSGTGEFVNNGDEWGDKKRNVIHLTYTATNGVYTLTATDTLVIRDRGITMQTYSPLVTSK